MSQAVPVIAIDGPSGSGKGTISRLVADRLGWRFLDSGALYRLVALAAERHGIAESNEPGLATLATHLDAAFSSGPDGDTRISLEGEDVSNAIRRESCGNAASKVAALPGVRDALLARQRAFRESPGLVADGRDMGTVVFPDAEVKIFLTASAEERAKRRHKQLNEKGVGGSLTGLIADIAARDARDSERAVSPLKPAPDAHVLDTTALDIGAVVERVMAIVDERLNIRSD